MAYQKPYTFRAGTYAKAAEVNANFDTLKDFVNELLTTFQEKIVGLQVYNKANKEGDATQIFKAAQGTNANDVVINSQLTTTNSRVTTLEQMDTFVIPDYSNPTTITSRTGTFTNDGIFYIENASTSNLTYRLGSDSDHTYQFRLYGQGVVAFIPVKAGTYYHLDQALDDYTVKFFAS